MLLPLLLTPLMPRHLMMPPRCHAAARHMPPCAITHAAMRCRHATPLLRRLLRYAMPRLMLLCRLP
jgi:hypothetical protein